MANGGRQGLFLENDQSAMPLRDDAGLQRREGRWHALREGERIVSVSGRQSTMGYLCGCISFTLSSGREVVIDGSWSHCYGESFEAAAPDGHAIVGVAFDGNGRFVKTHVMAVDDAREEGEEG